MVKRIVYALLLSSFVLVSCQEKKQEKEAQVYKTMKVERSSQTVKTQYSATMKGKEIVEIRPQVSGLITKILTAEGQKVHKGLLGAATLPDAHRQPRGKERPAVEHSGKKGGKYDSIWCRRGYMEDASHLSQSATPD